MTTDLHERLHEALATAEIPSYQGTLTSQVLLDGRGVRRRRVWTATAGVAAVAATVVGAGLALGTDPQASSTLPAATSPSPMTATLPTALMLSAAEAEVVDGRLHVATSLSVAGRPVVLVPEVYGPGGTSIVELVAEQTIGPDDGSGSMLLGSSLVVTGEDQSPGWTMAAVVSREGTLTGQVVGYGVLPTGSVEWEISAPGMTLSSPLPVVGSVALDTVPGKPAAWGRERGLFAFSVDAPMIAGAPSTPEGLDLDVTVQARVDGVWVDLQREGTAG